MNPSHPQGRPDDAPASSAQIEQKKTGQPRVPLLSPDQIATPGSMNDAGLIRQVITSGMRNSGLSRAEIADRMSYFAGTEVTERMLSAFAAESRDDVRFPSQLERAFCAAVGDNQLLTCKATLAHLHFVDETGLHLMELGREYLKEKRAAENKAAIETKLRGVKL